MARNRPQKWMIAAVVLAALLYGLRYVLLPRTSNLPDLNGTVEQVETEFQARVRHYRFYRPAQLRQPAPLLFVFHGSQSDGASMRALSAHQFDRVADREGFIVVYPDGVDRHWNDCRASASYVANTANIDDVGFVRQIIDELSARVPVDRDRIFATGFSNGGHMALRLALEAPELMRAVAPLAANLPVDDNLDCRKSGQAVSLAFVNGTHDPINPYEGGVVKLLWDDSRGNVLSAADSATYFATLAGYVSPGERRMLPDNEPNDDSAIRVTRWRGRDHEVRLYTVVSGGHSFPSRHTRFGWLLGGDNRDIDIADELWEFFSTQDRR